MKKDMKKYLLLIGLTLAVSFIIRLTEGNGDEVIQFLERPPVGNEYEENIVQITAEGSGQTYSRSWGIKLYAREYGEGELDSRFAQAKQYLEQNLFCEGENADGVSTKLNLVERIPDSLIRVAWEIDEPGYVLEDGRLNPDRGTESHIIAAKALLNYGSREESFLIPVRILPPDFSEEEKFWKLFEGEIVGQEQISRAEDRMNLPGEAGGYALQYIQKNPNLADTFLFGGIIICILMYVVSKRHDKEREEKRKQELLYAYPELVYKFVLLAGAGIPIGGVWRRLAGEYEMRKTKTGDRREVYEEILLTLNEIRNGKSEEAAYDAFGSRINLIPYLRFSSILTQNLKLGSKEILKRLESEAVEALEERKKLALIEGEKAGTKLLLPMMVMLLLVMGIIMIPAFMGI